MLKALLCMLFIVLQVSAFTVMPSRASTGRMALSMISHGKGFNKLGLPADQRKALLRGLTTEVIRHGRIRTTIARAKELRSRIDHMITLAKKGTLHTRRQALAYLYDKDLVILLYFLSFSVTNEYIRPRCLSRWLLFLSKPPNDMLIAKVATAVSSRRRSPGWAIMPRWSSSNSYEL